jgi:hypothetical protein
MKVEIYAQVEVVLLPFSLRWFLRSANGGGQKGANCRANLEVTPKQNIKLLRSAKNLLLLNANSDHEYEMTSWESLSVASTLLEITSLISALKKRG